MTFDNCRRSVPYLALAAVFFCCTFAGATSITYDLIGATTLDGTLTGTVSIDNLTGLVTAADITFNDAAVGNPVFTDIGSPNSYNKLGQDYISGPSNDSLNWGGQIALYYDLTDLTSVGDLNLCLSIGPCGTESNQASYVQAYVSGGDGGPFLLTGGSLDPLGSQDSAIPAAVTTEPSSLVLLGTGILGLGFFIARHRRSDA